MIEFKIKLHVMLGTPIEDAIHKAVELANKLGVMAEFKLNDQRILVSPETNVADAIQRYHNNNWYPSNKGDIHNE